MYMYCPSLGIYKKEMASLLSFSYLITGVEQGGQGITTGSILTHGATPGGRTFKTQQLSLSEHQMVH